MSEKKKPWWKYLFCFEAPNESQNTVDENSPDYRIVVKFSNSDATYYWQLQSKHRLYCGYDGYRYHYSEDGSVDTDDEVIAKRWSEHYHIYLPELPKLNV